jgi:uncharacterized protein (TIGR03086 family)
MSDLTFTVHPAAVSCAAAPFRDLVSAVRPEQLDDATPCSGYDVRGLLNHILYWTPRLRAALRKDPPPEEGGGAAELGGPAWADEFRAQVDGLVNVLAEPAAWTGTARLGGGDLPAAMVGSMVLCEFVVHGWDVARATGQAFTCAPETAAAVHEVLTQIAPQGRRMGAFGPEVEVAATAPLLDRALGLAGRDPAWPP